MAATLASLIIESGNLIGDPRDPTVSQDGERFSNADLITYLNEAQDEMNRLSGLLRAKVPVSLVANTASYAVLDSASKPPDTRILRMENSDGTPVFQATKEELDAFSPGWETQTGTPPTYWILETGGYGVIRIFPVPTGPVTLYAWITERPTPMAALTDPPAMPDLYSNTLPFYAAWKCLLRNRESSDLQMAMTYLQTWQERLQQALGDPLGLKAS